MEQEGQRTRQSRWKSTTGSHNSCSTPRMWRARFTLSTTRWSVWCALGVSVMLAWGLMEVVQDLSELTWTLFISDVFLFLKKQNKKTPKASGTGPFFRVVRYQVHNCCHHSETLTGSICYLTWSQPSKCVEARPDNDPSQCRVRWCSFHKAQKKKSWWVCL